MTRLQKKIHPFAYWSKEGCTEYFLEKLRPSFPNDISDLQAL
jgi:hypothetical protein